MYNQTIYNGLINVVPFWSSNLIQIYGLGNEYNIVFNLIITELLKITTTTFNDNTLLFITFLLLLLFVVYKNGYTFNINLFERNIIILKGTEILGQNSTTLEYCDKIFAINDYLLQKKKIKNISYIDDVNIIVNNISNFKLDSKIILNIKRNNVMTNNAQYNYVYYELISYYPCIDDFIDKVIIEYKKKINSQITLIGNEANNIISYPEPIHAINYFVNSHFQFPKLICMKMTNSSILNDINNNKSENTNIDTNANTNNKKSIEDKKKSKNNYSYTLDNIINFDLGKVLLTINRENDNVIYNIKSNKINCNEWLNEIVNSYNQNKNSPFKNKMVLTGREEIWFRENSFKNYYYSKAMWTINWLLIEKLNFQNYECVNGNENELIYNYVLEPLELFKIQEDLFLTIEKENRKYWYSSHEKNKHNNNMDIVYTLYSNSLNIKDVLEKYIEQFDLFKNKITQNKILYHFTYSGMKDGQLIFSSKILSESNTDKELFETFDKIYNEHVDFFKKDIDKLRNIEYYKKHGLKRKKGYLFHGIPGCGKTSSVVAMALYDSRHIIEIPFSLLTTHQEFEKIMELKSINNIEINNNNIILLFDEIDIGMEKIGSRNNDIDNKVSEQTNSNNSNNIVEGVVKAMMTFDTDEPKNTTEQKINLGTLLSKLDGIGNYNGLIVIGTTNHINKLDPALYRELRLTPIKFDKLRKEDCIKIIQSYFGSNYDEKLNDILVDRKITPTKLIHLCHQYEDININEFFNKVLIDLMN